MPCNLSDDTHDILDVPFEPVKIVSKIGTPEFDSMLLAGFMELLKQGHKYVPSNSIAKWLKIDRHEIEAFLDKDERFSSRKRGENVFTYGLRCIEDSFPIGNIGWEIQLIHALLSDDKVWKTPEFLAKKLSCEVDDFKNWADKCNYVARRNGKEAGKTYYSLNCRLNKQTETKSSSSSDNQEKKKTVPIPPSVNNKELFAYAMLRNDCDELIRHMNFNANQIATRHPEVFGYLTQAQAALMAAISIWSTELKIDDKDLPELSNI